MNIAFDMGFTNSQSMNRGIGRYSKNLIKDIINLAPENVYHFFYPDFSQSQEQLKEQLQTFLQQHKIDVFHIHSPINFEHFSLTSFMMEKTWFGDIKVVVTLYDLIPLIYKQQYLRNPDDEHKYMKLLDFIKSCDALLAISETTKNDAIAYAGMDPDKITVIMGGYDEMFRPIPNYNGSKMEEFYFISSPYILCVSGMGFRKNTERVIEAFAVANRQLNNKYQLVICCEISSDQMSQLRDIANRFHIPEHKLVITGYVPDEHLVQLYNGASLLAFPSLYEGFGLPVVEAMACGTPVLTSNNSSLRELAGEAAHLVSPENIEQITQGMVTVLSEPEVRDRLVRSGWQRVSLYQWSQVAGKTLNVYKELAGPRIAVFTPLPPLRTGIADYFTKIVSGLSSKYRCDIYIDHGYEPEHMPLNNVYIYPHEHFESSRSKYTAVIYQMGNSHFHAYMIPYLRKYEGIIILHDLNLLGLTVSRTLHQNDIQGYYSAFTEQYGEQGINKANMIIETKNYYSSDIIINKYYLNMQYFIVVHNNFSKNRLIGEGYSNVYELKLPVHVPDKITHQHAGFIFTSFGHLARIKHHNLVIRAIKRMVDLGFHNVEYHLVGYYHQSLYEEYDSLSKSLGVSEHIKFFNYPNQEEYSKKMAETDVAINLRNPTNGETSAALIDVMSHGLPVIVSDTDSFSEYPDDVVYRIRFHQEVEDRLTHAMIELYLNPERRSRLGEKARAYIREHHTVAQYIDGLSKLIDACSMARKAVVTQGEPLHEESQLIPETERRRATKRRRKRKRNKRRKGLFKKRKLKLRKGLLKKRKLKLRRKRKMKGKTMFKARRKRRKPIRNRRKIGNKSKRKRRSGRKKR